MLPTFTQVFVDADQTYKLPTKILPVLDNIFDNNYIIAIVVIVVVAMLMHRFYEVKERRESAHNKKQLHQYLLDDLTLGKNKKPMLWIYIPYELNARNWVDFQSRTSMGLNQPYLYLTIQTIIEKCDDSFKICLYK